ncbi:MAG TPA: ADP-ribosylglycohydrolase family protein [Sedimentisphaerales bacterium]|nr:ADP-ribosylglycohydrolase family protein [Sedimentisphaerales bacterium]
MNICRIGLSALLIVCCVGASFAQDNPVRYRELSMAEYKDKVAGGWIGQAVGVLWGQWTEGKWQGQMVPFDLKDWYRIKPEVQKQIQSIKDQKERAEFQNKAKNDLSHWEVWQPDQMSDQDDLYIEFMFLHSIRKYGLDVTAREIAEDWVKYLDKDRVWCANRGAYGNFLKGIWPPQSGHPRYTPWGDAIDFQIEADMFGLICPGLPRISNAWGDKVGHIMNYGDGVYAGMAMAAMYGEAFFESDPHKLAEYSQKAIPAESGYAQMVRDVLELHEQYPNWEDAWRKLEPKWGQKDGKRVGGVDVRINGAYVYMGLLYGDGDFWKTMNISMRCGRDSDCNPSSSVGIMGTALGLKAIPDKWNILRDLPIENRAISEIYPALIQWDDIVEATVEVGKWNILQHGGYMEKGVFYIPCQVPTSPPLEQTIWEETENAK